jgi:hypothetical protein
MMLLDWLTGPLGAALAGILALAGAWLAGKRSGRQKAAQKAAEDAVKAHKTRERIEDEISQDTSLADRARRSGIVRKKP